MSDQLYFSFYYDVPLTDCFGRVGIEYGLTFSFICWNYPTPSTGRW